MRHLIYFCNRIQLHIFVPLRRSQQNRHTMDCHNNPIGVRVGLSYPGYSYAMPEGLAKNMARYVAHVTRYGSHYDVYEMTADDMGFIHTTEGRRNSLLPPYC